MLKEITKWISNNVAGMTIGTNLIEGHRLQNSPDRCVLISEQGGGTADYYTKDMKFWMIQIITRGVTYYTAREDAYKIHNFIHGAAGWYLPVVDAGTAYFLATCECVSLPQFIGFDEKRRFQFSTNYRCIIYNKNGI